MKLCGGGYYKEYKDYICVDDMGHLVTPDYVTRVFREMLLKNGFRPIRYHDLRHSCASLLIKNKVTMKEVQMWLGHSSFPPANIYAHIDVDSKMEAANMIASKINLGELPEEEISQTKNRLGENSVGRTCPPKPTENKSVLSVIWHKKWQTKWRTNRNLVCHTKIPKPLKA